MKPLLLFLALPLMFIFALPAQITQEKADEIAIERMGSEIGFTLYAKDDVQPEGFTVATATGETLELDYPCWVYFAKYTGKTNHKYLIVKESNGNLLEINTKNDVGVDNIEEWRKLFPKEIPFEEYPLSETMCIWAKYPTGVTIINSNEELEPYISCAEGSYPEIDFSKYTLLFVTGSQQTVLNTTKQLYQLSQSEYQLDIKLQLCSGNQMCWFFAIITDKLDENCTIKLNIKTTALLPCQITKITYSGSLILINSYEELENYLECSNNTYFPEIDFSKHTLLLVGGFLTSSPAILYDSWLIKTEENDYNLNLFLKGGGLLVPTNWMFSLLIAKLPPDVVFTLNLN